jgi:hypothetical protein
MAEEKKVDGPAFAGFYKAMEETNAERLPVRHLLEYLKVPVTVKILTWKVETKMPKIDPGGRVIPSSESQPSSRVKLIL